MMKSYLGCVVILATLATSTSYGYDDLSFERQDFSFKEPEVAPPPPRPVEFPTKFVESDFQTKPWMRDFEYVVVVSKTEAGPLAQTARVYHKGRPVSVNEIQAYLFDKNLAELDEKKYEDRQGRIVELESMTKGPQPTVFKISTGRDQFERKGENHGQKDQWTVTPAGYYTPQHLSVKHKSEVYSSSVCDSWLGKLASAILQKELCTMMEYAIFFNGGIATHKALPGSEKALGRKASGGCVRMPAALAEFLFDKIGQTRAPGVLKIPQFDVTGMLKTDSVGRPQYSPMTKSVWGEKPAWSALIIVTNE